MVDFPKKGQQFATGQKLGIKDEYRPRILVVDDSEGIRGYLTNLLEIRGYEVTGAESGEAAIASLEESSTMPDLVFLDIMMPGLGGIETLRRLRAIMPGLSVAMISVVGRAPTIVNAMKLGAVDSSFKGGTQRTLEPVRGFLRVGMVLGNVNLFRPLVLEGTL